MAAKMVTIFGDVTALWQRHHPRNIPHLVKKIKGFPLRVKSFQNTATYQNSWEGFHPPPPLLIPWWGMNLRVLPRVKQYRILFTFFKGYRCNWLSVITPKEMSYFTKWPLNTWNFQNFISVIIILMKFDVYFLGLPWEIVFGVITDN